MARHPANCVCRQCEHDGTGEFADRDAAEAAQAIDPNDPTLHDALYRMFITPAELPPERLRAA